jgi:radical SAM superfamily enzyme YgiQ (UPF0313 family)
MKILLTTLNAKYIHTTLALYYLKAFSLDLGHKIYIKEFTINRDMIEVMGEINQVQADIICFSCYIWNIEHTLQLCLMIKKVSPQTEIVLGGPEVSYDYDTIMQENKSVDYLIFGEGEATFRQFLDYKARDLDLIQVEGLVWREEGRITRVNRERPLIAPLDSIPFPYGEEDMKDFTGKIIYYETGRGCPFSCRYCLSSTLHSVRYFSLERVKKDLAWLIASGTKLVKFVDRTFNCHQERTKEILAYLLTFQNQKIKFHFEIAADLLDDEMINLFRQAPPGYFQMEIGVQSTNRETLSIIDRKMDFSRVEKMVRKLKKLNNVHLHLDLIAGLPGESMLSFEKSFNDVYFMQPHQIQLGFLKVLKGTGLRDQAKEYGLVFQDQPPYEILQTEALSFDHLTALKTVENTLEKYYNSGKFVQTLAVATGAYSQGPFDFFHRLSIFLRERAAADVGTEAQAQLLLEFLSLMYPRKELMFRDLVKLDRLLIGRKTQIPYWLDESNTGEELTIKFVRQEDNVHKYLPHLDGLSAKNIYKSILVQKFKHSFEIVNGVVESMKENPSYILFDYSCLSGVSGYPTVTCLNEIWL